MRLLVSTRTYERSIWNGRIEAFAWVRILDRIGRDRRGQRVVEQSVVVVIAQSCVLTVCGREWWLCVMVMVVVTAT